MLKMNLETKRGSILIREAMISDLAQFRELRLDALQESPTSFPGDYSTYTERPMSFWESRLKSDETGTLFFADRENQLVGMTGVRRGDSSKTKHSATIWGVYVRPQWRGLRIADALIALCIEWAKLNGVNIVTLGVTAASTSAVRGYERCGFVISGTEPRGIFYEGKYYDGYFMYRLLDNF
jgi:RimJ/RimL family protein N-acetyltransferase